MTESFANINFPNGTVEATVENTVVYNHYGMNEVYDHVFVKHDNGEYGCYVWKENPPSNPVYDALAAIAVQSGCEVHINVQTPAECDVKAFGKAALQDLTSMPDWMPEA